MVAPSPLSLSTPRKPSRHVTDKIASLPPGAPYYTFEVPSLSSPPLLAIQTDQTIHQVFPPKTAIGTSNLISRLSRMSSLSPTWIHITWGAGGSTQERSLELAGEVEGMGLESCLHLTCTNMRQEVLDEALAVSLLSAG